MSDEIHISEATRMAIDLIAAEYQEQGHDMTPEQVLAWAVEKLRRFVFFKPEHSENREDEDAGEGEESDL